MILHGRIVDQAIDRPAGLRASFIKEVVVTRGVAPLAMVRKRCAKNGGGTLGTVLLVHGFGQNRYAWHLPSRSFANHLAVLGYDVFNLDLRGHGRSRHFGSKRPRSVAEYVDEDLPSAVEEILAVAGDKPLYLVGHSLGGLVSYAAAPGLTGAVSGIASIGSPYHFTRGSFSLGAVAAFVRVVSALDVRPNPALLLKPVGFGMAMMRRFAESPLYPIPWRGWHKGGVEPDILDEHLRLAFDRAGLAEVIDMFEWANERQFGGSDSDYAPRFEALDLPLLVVAGVHDDLAPPASVRPGFTASRSRDKTYRAVKAGHIDLLIGRDAPKTTWPIVGDWLGERIARTKVG